MHHASGLRRAADLEREQSERETDESGRQATVRRTADMRSRKRAGGHRTADLRSPSRDVDLKRTDDLRALRPADRPDFAPLDRRPTGRDPWLGRLVDGRYKVVEIIGRGGMGVVYKVEHQRMSKIAAMKVLHQEFASDTEVTSRFRREAEAVSRLTHPNTVQVYDFGTERGFMYLIMEYVRGRELGKLVKRDGPLRFLRAAPLFGQIGAALAEAHAKGIVHRDLKPENVLVTRTHRGRDFVKVLDFGLAKLGEREDPGVETERGLIVGTPYYMSPEQIRGDEVDPRSDIYSLGALMYKVLTGQYVFTSKTPVGVLTKHLTNDVTPPSERAPAQGIDPLVDEMILRALAKEPGDRFQDIESFLGSLEDVFARVCGDAPSGPMSVVGFGSLSGSSPSGAPRQLGVPSSDEVDYGMDSNVRLLRTDLAAFERSLKRKRRLGVALVPLIIAALGGAAVYMLVLRGARTYTVEHEPNNSFDQATLIATGTSVTGHLGRRIDKGTSDRDFYRIEQVASAEGNQAVWLHVTGLPNMDVELVLLDGTGNAVDRVNEGGIGQDEWIRNLRLRGPLAVMVSEAKTAGPRLPTENVSDTYTLTAELRPVGTSAAEPNDSRADAVTLAPGTSVTGYLDRRGDVDMFDTGDAAGQFELRIDGAASAPISWQVGRGTPQKTRRATVTLTPGAIISLRRDDDALPHGQALPSSGDAYTISITRR